MFRGLLTLLAVVGLATFFTFASRTIFNSQPSYANSKSEIAHIQRKHSPICTKGGKGQVSCTAHVITQDNGAPLASGSLLTGSYGPAQFHIGYSLPCTPGGAVQSACPTPAIFGPQKIAIVDAYHYPTVENDLNVYSQNFGLPPCTVANGCLKIINQTGGTTLPSTVDAGWALEEALDTQIAHAICQTCQIVMIEANSNLMSDLATAENTAASLGATAISNSYAAPEWSTEGAFDSYYNHPGIAVTASAGDNGYGPLYPAAYSNVVAVGGTALNLYTDSTYANESVWNGTGSGCSAYESADTTQTVLSNWLQTGCATHRAITDIAADADPNTGAAIYDSTSYSGFTGWFQVGGTSLASPIIAATFALAGGVSANTNGPSVLYNHFSLSNFHDVTSGANGNCSTVMCLATGGYDGPTGLGTPNTIAGFGGSITTPTPTPSPTSTPTPTATPVPQTGSISGTVYSSAGGVVSGAKITTKVNGSNVSTTTDVFGNYAFNNLKPGTYSLTYSAKNYTTQSVKVSVLAGQTTMEDVTLRRRR